MKVLLKLKYDGAAFSGYQVQMGRRTVQGELCRAASELFGHECSVTGCSRTDAGVHAECFCATVSNRNAPFLTSSVPADKIAVALNAHLPDDISVFEVRDVPDSFHPRYDVKEKTYIYKILNTRYRDPFFTDRAWFIPGVVFSADDIERMILAAEYFVGCHNFAAFMASGSKITDPVRTVTHVGLQEEDHILRFEIAADGFLYNMVRIIVGTLAAVGAGRINPEDIPVIIASRDRSRAGLTAPPHGLYLHNVKY